MRSNTNNVDALTLDDRVFLRPAKEIPVAIPVVLLVWAVVFRALLGLFCVTIRIAELTTKEKG